MIQLLKRIGLKKKSGKTREEIEAERLETRLLIEMAPSDRIRYYHKKANREKLADAIIDHLRNPNLTTEDIEVLQELYDIKHLPLEARLAKAKHLIKQPTKENPNPLNEFQQVCEVLGISQEQREEVAIEKMARDMQYITSRKEIETILAAYRIEPAKVKEKARRFEDAEAMLPLPMLKYVGLLDQEKLTRRLIEETKELIDDKIGHWYEYLANGMRELEVPAEIIEKELLTDVEKLDETMHDYRQRQSMQEMLYPLFPKFKKAHLLYRIDQNTDIESLIRKLKLNDAEKEEAALKKISEIMGRIDDQHITLDERAKIELKVIRNGSMNIMRRANKEWISEIERLKQYVKNETKIEEAGELIVKEIIENKWRSNYGTARAITKLYLTGEKKERYTTIIRTAEGKDITKRIEKTLENLTTESHFLSDSELYELDSLIWFAKKNGAPSEQEVKNMISGDRTFVKKLETALIDHPHSYDGKRIIGRMRLYGIQSKVLEKMKEIHATVAQTN